MMQKWRSHKEVHAGKIQGIHRTGTPETGTVGYIDMVTVGGAQYSITPEMTARYEPDIGDYLVKYADGYLSFSPAAAFESGYTLVEDIERLHKEMAASADRASAHAQKVGEYLDEVLKITDTEQPNGPAHKESVQG